MYHAEVSDRSALSLDELRGRSAADIARAVLDAGLLDDDDLDDDSERTPYWHYFLASLEQEVGGRDNLDQLSTDPLPDEPFDWNGVPDDIRPRITAVLSWSDRYCDEQLDTEARTVARRLLNRIARNDPAIFRRKSRDDYSAGALIWLTGQVNDIFNRYGTMTVKNAMSFLGIKNGSVSQKGQLFRRAAGLDCDGSWTISAGDLDLLTSSTRTRILEKRDHWRAIATEANELAE